jgi:hypothetical protein
VNFGMAVGEGKGGGIAMIDSREIAIVEACGDEPQKSIVNRVWVFIKKYECLHGR